MTSTLRPPPPVPPREPPTAPTPRFRRWWGNHPVWSAALLAFGFLVLGAGIGALGAEKDPEVVTEIKTVEVAGPTVTSIVEKTVEVEREVTPPVCFRALDYANDAFGLNTSTFEHFGEAFAAMLTQDQDRFDVADRQIDENITRMHDLAPRYTAARDACRAGG